MHHTARRLSENPYLRALFRLVPYLFAGLADGRKGRRHPPLHGQLGLVVAIVCRAGIVAGAPQAYACDRELPGWGGGGLLQQSFSRVRPSLSKAKLIAVPSGYLGQVFARVWPRNENHTGNIIDRQIFRPTERNRTAKGYTLVVKNPRRSTDWTALRGASACAYRDVILRVAGSGPERPGSGSCRASWVWRGGHFEGRLSRERSCGFMLRRMP